MNQTLHVICLAYFLNERLNDTNDPEMKELREHLERGMRENVIKPISRIIYEHDQAEEAFRFMASGKHIGKVLIRMYKENSECVINSDLARVSFDTNKSFIVVGGLGGMGIEVSQWLVKNGVGTLIITSRTGIKSTYHRYVIERLEELGTKVLVKTNNVSVYEEAEDLIRFAQSIYPVGGIFNLGMAIQDALFEDQTKESFENVCNIKIKGTYNLDMISRKLCPQLDHFVCFSSIASSNGNHGQSNYGFANSSMESICHNRKNDGLPSLAIAWGAVGDVGHVAENLSRNSKIHQLVPQRINSCLEVLSSW